MLNVVVIVRKTWKAKMHFILTHGRGIFIASGGGGREEGKILKKKALSKASMHYIDINLNSICIASWTLLCRSRNERRQSAPTTTYLEQEELKGKIWSLDLLCNIGYDMKGEVIGII